MQPFNSTEYGRKSKERRTRGLVGGSQDRRKSVESRTQILGKDRDHEKPAAQHREFRGFYEDRQAFQYA